MIRPLLPADVPAARDVQWAALSELDVRLGQTTPELTPEIRARGEGRIAHLQHTDPESAWVAEINGTVVGCGLALVREGMWFLSLLMVDLDYFKFVVPTGSTIAPCSIQPQGSLPRKVAMRALWKSLRLVMMSDVLVGAASAAITASTVGQFRGSRRRCKPCDFQDYGHELTTH